ncbi:hypothetical protein [Alkalilacustris brevis]|uniref:hypothetical protein n=1 Tax=Alkalilacustris brevis TaxID=2026338 RepID=UPI0012D2A863|nr:hypothetical protein [Alkalilacustris brevis]
MPDSSSRPFHLTVIAVAALLWQGVWAVDYLAHRLDIEAWLAHVPPGWTAFLDAQPAWGGALWAAAVWAGFLGAVLLLMAERGAVLLFALAFLAMMGWLGVLLLEAAPVPDFMGYPGWQVAFAAALVLFLLWLYARALKTRGRLG